MPRPGTQPAQEPSSSRPLSPKRTTQTSEPVPQPIEVARNHRSRDPEEGNRRINEQKPTSLAIPHSPLAKDLERKQRVREAARKRQQRHRLAVRQRRLLEVEARLVGSSDIAGTHQNHPTTPLTPYPDLLSDEEHTTATSNSDYVQTSGNSLPASTHGHSQQLDIAHLESSSKTREMYQSHFDGVNDRHEAISRSMNFSHTSNQTSVSRRLGIPTAAATVDYGVTTRKFVGGPDYVHLALYELRRCFSFIPFSYLQHQFQAHHYLYAPTYLFMLSEVQEMQRTTQPLMPDPLIVTLDLTIQYTSADSDNRVLFDAEFEAERNWLATHLISTRGRNRSSKQYPVTQRHDILENSRCEACFTNANSDAIARCPSGHTFCHLCIFNRIKALELNSSQLDVICLKSSCHSPFSKGVLRQILPYEPMERYQRFLRPHPQSHPHPHPEPSRQDMHKVTARPVLCKLEEVDGYDRALLSSTKRTPPTLPSINTSIIPPRLSMSLPNTPRAAVDTDALRKLDKHAVRPYSASPGDNKKQELPAVIRCRTQPLRGKSTPPLGRVRFNSVGLDRRHSAPSVVRPSPYPTRRERQPHRRAGTCTPTQSAAPSLPNPAAVSDAVADGHAPGNSVVVSPIPEDSSCKNPLLRPGNLSLEPWYPLNQQAQPVTRDYTLSGSGSQITGHSSSLQILHYHPGGVRSDLFVVTRGHE